MIKWESCKSMKIVEINYGIHGSTGNIMLELARFVRAQGETAYTFSASRKTIAPIGHEFFGYTWENLAHRIIGMSTGISGKGSVCGTRNLLRKIKQIQPDIIHLHNLHGWFINIPMLFEFIRENKIKTVWTLHDCWSFTAQCSHFVMEGCYKWREGCCQCPRYRLYPNSYVDRTPKMYKLKKQWFSNIENLILVSPSNWLSDLARQSFLKNYPVKVIPNGIDLNIFKPTYSDFKKRYNCLTKKIILGVASPWGYRKGLDVFIELANSLDKKSYQIVLVGTDERVDGQLPSNIISIHRTSNKKELAEIYTAADLFVNPTREDNYPTVNMEALACGTPVLTFETGGSPEIIDKSCGSVIAPGDSAVLKKEIEKMLSNMIYSQHACLTRAKEFEQTKIYEMYLNLYRKNFDLEWNR